MIPDKPHFHSKSLTFLGILKYAILEKRKDLIEWTRRAYDWAYAQGAIFGWFPEGVGAMNHEPTPWSETCCTTDMIEIALCGSRKPFALRGNCDHKDSSVMFPVRSHS